jgi:membrane-associated phospholipid phosphatase
VLEIAGVFVLYSIYDRLRDEVAGSATVALRNARQVVQAERFFGLYHELRLQAAFLDWHAFISFWNVYYGTVHFVLPVVALIVLYRKAPARYLRWRNTLLFMLGFALVGFWIYPLAPPRLMPPSYEFVDTAAQYFTVGPQQPIRLDATGEPIATARAEFGNLYAAMPSLHVGWSTWTTLALLPVLRRRWLRALLCLYPAATLFGIVVTGNHWLLDAVGGWLVLAAAYAAAGIVARLVVVDDRDRAGAVADRQIDR